MKDNKLTVVRQDSILQVIYEEHQCQIIAIEIGNYKNKNNDKGEKSKKIVAKLNFVFQQPSAILSQFQNAEQFYQYMKEPLNYYIDFENSSMILKWKIIAHSFRRKIEYKLQMQQKQFTLKQALKCEVMSLKKLLAEYQKAEQCRRKRNIKRRKGFKQINETIQNHCNGSKSNNKSIFMNQNDNKNGIEDNQQMKSKKKRINKKYSIRRGRQIRKTIEKIQDNQNQQMTNNNNKLNQQKLYSDNYGQQDSSYEKSYEKLSINDLNLKDQDWQKPQQKQQAKNTIFSQLLIEQKDLENANIVESYLADCSKQKWQQQNDKDKEVDQINKNKKIRFDFTNGDYYYGEVKNGQYHGEGIQYIHADGTNYEGEFRNGKRQGHGKKWDKEGNLIEGTFLNGKIHGKGIETLISCEKYEGDYVMGMKQGFGTYYYKNGEYYEGEWKNDMFDGLGKQVYSDGSWFEGIWIQDQIHGKGILHSDFGDIVQIYCHGKLISTTPLQNGLCKSSQQ